MAAPSDVHRHRSLRTPSWNRSLRRSREQSFQIGERLQRIFAALAHARGAAEPAPGGDVGDGAGLADNTGPAFKVRSEEHTSELQSLMRTSYAVFCLKKKKDDL